MASKHNSGVIVAGLALFSMFFGAGDLIWPLILGGSVGDKNPFAVLGLILTGVSLPLLGLLAMMLFNGNYRSFFGQTGKTSGFILILIIQAILGPFGSIPRLITLSFATLKPYMPEMINLAVFSILSSALVLLLTIKQHRVIDLLGLILSPLLLISLGTILLLGFYFPHPAPEVVEITGRQAFFKGCNVGYNTLDLIASFIFAPFVLSYFISDEGECLENPETRRLVFRKMIKACCFAAVLLSLMYLGQSFIASIYTPILPAHAPEERLAAISLFLLGKKGALFTCMSVAMACLTTAIPISVISANYIQKDLMKGKGTFLQGALISLGISTVLANLGFMGIADMLSPILQILCPGLILLSILNIFHKLYEMKMRRLPVFAAFAISMISYLVR